MAGDLRGQRPDDGLYDRDSKRCSGRHRANVTLDFQVKVSEAATAIEVADAPRDRDETGSVNAKLGDSWYSVTAFSILECRLRGSMKRLRLLIDQAADRFRWSGVRATVQ